MSHRGEFEGFPEWAENMRALPAALVAAKRAFEPDAERIADAIKDEKYLIVSGAGATWPEAFYYGMCILEEMQWIRTRPVHASDFFHGTLELVEKDVGILLLKGEDEYRPLVERVEAFARRYTENLTVIDTVTSALPGIATSIRPLSSPIVLATLLERVSAHLEVKRAHPLTTRRYYKRVEY
jgi:fructoselysine-6-phosphate deglycase